MLDLLEFLAQLIVGGLIVAVAAPLVVLAGFVTAFYLLTLPGRLAGFRRRPTAGPSGDVHDADLDTADVPAKPSPSFGMLDGVIGYHDPCDVRFRPLVDARLLDGRRVHLQ